MIEARARSWIGERLGWRGQFKTMCLLALALLVTLPAFGDDAWVGKLVIQKDRDFALKVGSKVVDHGDRMEVYRVEQVQDSWLWVKSDLTNLQGWVKADEVIPLDQAIPFFTGAIHAKHDDPLPYVLRARVWEAKHELDIALGDLDDAVRFDPTHAWVYNWRGILWREKHAYDKAISDHTEAIKLEPTDPHSYVNRALVFMDMKQYDKAIDDLNQAIRFNPENGRLFNKRGWAWYCKEDFDRAVNDYTQAIGLDPQLEDAYVNRGMARFANQEFDKAIEDYTHALKLDPADPFAYNDRGWAWQSKREFDKAIADFDQALKYRPRFVRALTNRGIVWAAKKDFKKALDDYNQALEIDPTRERSHTYRGIALTALRQFDRAIADFDASLKEDPTAVWPRYNRVIACLSAGRPEASSEARKLLEQVGWGHELAIHTAVLGYYSALRNGQVAEAQQFLKEAAARGNTQQWTYQVVRFLRGEIQEPELLGSATQPIQQTEAHSFLGLHNSLTGQSDRALSHFRWVKQNGLASDAGYELSAAELDRLENQKSAQRAAENQSEFVGQAGPQAQARARRLN